MSRSICKSFTRKNQDEDSIMKQHKLHFTTWLKDLNLPVTKIEEEKTIHLLTFGPYSMVKSWHAYDINGYTFYTKAKDSRRQCQNSGDHPEGSFVHADDGTGQKNAYYGYIEEIWQLNYGMLYKSLYLNVNGCSTHKVLSV
jgi:hypothetical protein